MASGIFRLIAAVCRTMTIANTAGTIILEATFLLGGIILPKGRIPDWWQWAYWVSPLSYGFNALTTNELFAPRWMNKLGSDNATKLGVAVLRNFGVTPDRKWFWIGAAAFLGLAVLFNMFFTLALAYLDSPGKPQATILEEAAKVMEVNHEETQKEPKSISVFDAKTSREMVIQKKNKIDGQ